MAIPRNLGNLASGADTDGVLGVTKGGTGAATLTANNVLLGNGTSAVQAVAPGTAGNTLTSNGTTWTSAAPTLGNTFQAVASGALSSGSTVILNSDGTVSVVAGQTQTSSSSIQFRASAVDSVCSVYDPTSQKLVVVYRDVASSGNGTAVIGTVSSSNITFGTPVVFQSSIRQDSTSVTYDTTNNKVVIIYGDSSTNGTAIVGTVSGTSISFGSAVIFDTRTGSPPYDGLSGRSFATYDALNGKVVICYISGFSTDDKLKSRVGTVSGTSISFGSATTVIALNDSPKGSFVNGDLVYNSTAQKVVVIYGYTNTSTSARKVVTQVATVSGTSISFSAEVELISGATNWSFIALASDTTSPKVVGVYSAPGVAQMNCQVGSISGTTITYGGEISVLSGTAANRISATYDSFANRVIIVYAGSSQYGTFIVGQISGSSISFTTPTVFVSSAINKTISTVYDPNNRKSIVSYPDNGLSDQGYSDLLTAGFQNLTSNNFLGISNAAYTNGQTATILIPGAVATQAGLTTGQLYYVQLNGTLSTSPASPSVVAGTALSTTQLLVKITL
jgi:ribosomal protein L14